MSTVQAPIASIYNCEEIYLIVFIQVILKTMRKMIKNTKRKMMIFTDITQDYADNDGGGGDDKY